MNRLQRARRAPPPGGRPARLALALWALAVLCLAIAAWLDHLLRRAGRPDLVMLTTGPAPLVALAHTSAATVGAVVAARRPRHPVGWLLLAVGLLLNATIAGIAYANDGLLAHRGSLPAAGWIALYQPATAVSALACLGFVLLLTPTGSPPSPRWRWLAVVMATPPLVLLPATALARRSSPGPYQEVETPLDLGGLRGALLAVTQAGLAIMLVGVVLAAASLVVRFRRARGAERQQLRWVALAAAVVLLLFAAAVGAVTTAAPGLPDPAAAGAAGLAVMALAIGAAILRYRLYDLDRIISRTVGYGLLTLLLGGTYAGLVLGFSQLLGHSSPLVVAVATLLVAAVFQPARRRVQSLVDRRFNRRRYDAARTIQGFSARLRQQVDLDTLTAELLTVVEQTMQPTRASLWLRPSAGAGHHGTRAV
jgi:hypothetical protein